MADQLERAFQECEGRGPVAGADALLDRVESRLNDETPSPLAAPSRDSWWSTVPGPAIAAVAALAVSLLVVGGVWLLGGFGYSVMDPVEEPEESAITTTAVTTTTLLPSTTVPVQALEAPWVEAGEIRIGSTVITKRALTVEGGRAVLEYNLTSLAPTGTAWVDEDGSEPVPTVLPELWEIETTHGSVQGKSVPTGRSVRFEVDAATTLDDITAIRLVSWRTIVPVTYDFTISADSRASVRMPDGSAIGVSHIVEMETGVLVAFDATLPPDHWGAVPCGDGMVGENCFEPVPGSGWFIRQSDSDLQIGADPGISLTDVPLRYRRPMWIRSEGSIELPLTIPEAPGIEPTDFPDGYVPLSESEAVKPTVITNYGEHTFVSLTSVTRRGVDPDSFDSLMGGRWLLETISGETLESIGMAYNDYVGGAFTVVFPGTDVSVALASVTLVEMWHSISQTGTAVAGSRESVVGSLPNAPVDVEFEDGSAIRVERFDIEGVGGYGTWFVPGDAPIPLVADVTGALIDREGTSSVATESWATPPRHFGVSNTGRLFWFWVTSDLADDDGLAVLPEEEHRVEIRVEAEVPIPIPVDIVIDLRDVPTN